MGDDDVLIEESTYRGFIIRYHRYGADHYVVCMNLRDGDLLEEENGVSIQDKLISLVSEEDLLSIFGRKKWRPVRADRCRLGFGEPVVGFHCFSEEFVPGLLKLSKTVIDRYNEDQTTP